jgi:protease IV
MKKSTKILGALFFLACGFVLLVFGTIFLVIFTASPTIPDGSYLVLDVSGQLGEQPTLEDPLAEMLGGDVALSVIEIDSALRKAAVDDRIAGVFVRVGPLACGMGKVQEIRDAIARYRETSGKPVMAWMDVGGTKEYYLAAACSEVYMAPQGMLLFTGLRFAMTFYKGTLDKLGVEAEFARVGEYKSAVETFTQEEMSESSREMMNSLADSLFAQIVDDVAADRGMTSDQMRAVVDDPPVTAEDAVEAGLVDELLYRDELEARFKPAEEEEWSLVSLGAYSQVSPSSLGLGGGPEIAVIYCEGAIMPGESSPPYYGGDRTMGSSTITRVLEDAREDENIEAVILRVDSPGGSGLASDLIWREVVLTREVKPVVVSMSDYAASGGYYIAMAADAVVAQPGTLTGSIGVYSGKFNLAGLYEKVGLSVETVERGAYAGLLSSSRSFTDEERQKLEEMVLGFYDTFITKAAEGRETDPASIDRVARGRVWSGQQALEVGLVDQLGGFREALDVAKELAGIDPDDEVSLVLLPAQRTLLEEILDTPSSSVLPIDDRLRAVLPEVDASMSHLLSVAPLLGSGTPVAMMPFQLVVY